MTRAVAPRPSGKLLVKSQELGLPFLRNGFEFMGNRLPCRKAGTLTGTGDIRIKDQALRRCLLFNRLITVDLFQRTVHYPVGISLVQELHFERSRFK